MLRVNCSGAIFIYDGTKLITETDSNNAILRRYVPGPDIDEPLARYEGSDTNNRSYYTTDRQGSVVGITLQSGAQSSTNTYDEYGIQKVLGIGRFQYTGQIWIASLGLYYYKARFYSPTLGKFLQTDPIGYKDKMNWYAYTNSDPINNTDPSGMNNCEVIGPDGKTTPVPNCTGNENAGSETSSEKTQRDKVDEIVVTGTSAKAGPNLQDAVNSPGEVGFKVEDGSLSSVQLSKTEVMATKSKNM